MLAQVWEVDLAFPDSSQAIISLPEALDNPILPITDDFETPPRPHAKKPATQDNDTNQRERIGTTYNADRTTQPNLNPIYHTNLETLLNRNSTTERNMWVNVVIRTAPGTPAEGILTFKGRQGQEWPQIQIPTES